MAWTASISPHALIVGAGPAGATAGLLLAKRGWRVTIIEQHRFPRDKVCGECLSATGCDVLVRAGVMARLTRAGAVRLGRTILHPANGAAIAIPLPRPCTGISRRAMDAGLLRAACDAGVGVRQPARCERVIADGPAALVRDLASNRLETLDADVILLADGKGALLGAKPAATGDLGVKAHFAHVTGSRDAVELFALGGHYAGLNPVEDNRCNLAMSIPADRVRAMRGDFDRILAEMLNDNAGLAGRLRGAVRVSDWLAAPLPRFGVSRETYPDGILPIGNAAAALEPIGGEGMGLAMRSAEIAAEAVDAACKAGRPARFADVAGSFHVLWRTRRLACRLSAITLSHPDVADPALTLLAANEPLQHATLRLVGK